MPKTNKSKTKSPSINASFIILGFTGSIGTGCSYTISALTKERPGGYNYVCHKLSKVIRDFINQTNPTIEEMQDAGNQLRKNKGNIYLIKTLIDGIKENYDVKDTILIIDGIKHQDEVKYLRQFPYFFLFSIHADTEIRANRVSNRYGRDIFNKADNRDRYEEYEYGQQVKICSDLADFIILNNKNISIHNTTERASYIRNIYDKYILPIKRLQAGEKFTNITPSVHELCMTIAYSLSQMSSCQKRKVGAVIVKTSVNGNKDVNSDKIIDIPFIVSSGYNEVSIGSYKCSCLPKINMCYRDFLKGEHASKIKFCPNCGTKIKVSISCTICKTEHTKFITSCCGKEIDSNIICQRCKIKVFEHYLPGSKETPGKLLDLCRALHAEENALLHLVNNNLSDELVLYVTTQPCNLCANKIVAVGIKKVVFCEPYLMNESVNILKAGKVELIRFQGIKSSAYFKLYY